MSALDDLRLAWEAHREGRPARRDALLTLAVAGAERGRRQWIKPILAFLLKSRPDHLFAGFERLSQALADPRVISRLDRLRSSFPPARVRWLVTRSDVARGPFTGRHPSIEMMIEDLTTASRRHAVSLGSTSPRSISLAEGSEPQSPTFNGDGLGFPPDADPLLRFYLSTLLATATLLAIVLRDTNDKQAA